MATMRHILGLLCGLAVAGFVTAAATSYFGTKIGPLSQLHHGVSGDVYAVDSRTILLKNFNYDGEGPAAYFYVGTGGRVSNVGATRLRDERGRSGVIRRYRNKDVTLSLPEGQTLRDIKWFAIWCDEFSVNFGDVKIPKNLNFPKPQKIDALSGVHGVASDNIVIVDAQTLLLPNFSYDGEAPDAKFWVGYGQRPTPNGIRIPDENGRENPLVRYDKKTIVLTLPGDLTVFEIGHFGIWCEAFTVDFGHVRIPQGINVPPSLRMLGISPESKLNCEVLHPELAFEVRWAVAGESVVVQLLAKLEDNEYLAFGLSPDKSHSVMIGADVTVAWVDKATGKGYANDYFLDAKSQCSGKRGSCPDTRIKDNTNSIRLLNAAMVNGYSIVTFQRPLKATDELDLPILRNESQAIVWAIGPLNERQEVSFHSQFNRADQFINFGRKPLWNCPLPEGKVGMGEDEDDDDDDADYYQQKRPTAAQQNRNPNGNANRHEPVIAHRHDQDEVAVGHVRRPVPTPKPAARNGAWDIPAIQCHEPEDGVFYAQMGPTGGKQGYPAITGHVGWGISWYINGLLIPEINVVRGKTYTFVVESGNDPEVPAKYHPFYITDDHVGGYEYKTDEERANIQIFAGVHRSRHGVVTPVGTGRLCNWTPDIDGPLADEYPSFGAYQRSLTLKCDEGEPGIITWRPDENTPDTVYYQCFTHRHLGWRINVLDSCESAQASEIDEVYAAPDEDTLLPEASIRHESKVRPNEIFLLQHEKDLIKNHNMNEVPPKLQFDMNKSSEISKIIADGIKAAEELEESIAKPHLYKNRTRDPIEHIEFKVIPKTREPTSTTSKPAKKYVVHQVDEVATLSEYLRPPGVQSGPLFRPVKVAGRRPSPTMVEVRGRPNKNQFRNVLPQPSIIVNHYKKPVSPLMRPFVKQQKPIKSIASFLMLGQPTDGGPNRKTYDPNAPTENLQDFKLSYKPPTPSASRPFKHQYRETQLPKAQPLKAVDHHVGQSSYNIPIRKKPNREPYLPVKAVKGTFKSPYEVTGPKVDNDISPLSSGFKPDSLIVEGGFKPIVRRRTDDIDEDEVMVTSNRRSDDNIELSEPTSAEGDALFVNQDIPTAVFEPMFIPSPRDNVNKKLLAKEHLTGDLVNMEVEEGDDKMAMAGEQVNAYYLPPDMPRTPPHLSAYPEGSVVTYDGKAVLDTSLVNSLPLPLPTYSSHTNVHSVKGHLSKTEQLIRNTPQFVPFRGEIPPIGQEFAPPELSRLRPPTQVGTHPDADRPKAMPVTEYTNPLTNSTNPISTKLVLLNPMALRNKREEEEDADELNATDDDDDAAAAQSSALVSIIAKDEDGQNRTIKVKGIVL